MSSAHQILFIYAVGFVGLSLFIFYELCVIEHMKERRHKSGGKLAAGYLVNSSSCKIPDLNPYDLSTAEFVWRENHIENYPQPPLTEIVFNLTTEETYLQINQDVVRFYTTDGIVHCCIYALQNRPNLLSLNRKCDYLSNKTWILNEKFQQFIVACHDSGKSVIYENIHATVVRPKRTKRHHKSKKNRLNVLVVGLDSISRLNLYRTMPRTVTHLHTHGWTELRGYSKIADNTLPNLMALLTGIPPHKLRSPHRTFFDGYPFIWKEFAAAGYVTAYVEDTPHLSTFNCHLKGFFKKPTDYYPFTFFQLAENYMLFRQSQSYLGFKSSSDHLFSYLLDFSRAHSTDPFFGLFWMNDFSHNNLNHPSSEDDQVLKTLQKLEQQGTLNTTMVVFLSDHGLRIGNIRKTRIGWYEDRLPFLFVSIPEWFKSQNYKEYLNLLNNADKLISPFDVYKTISHVLYGADLKDPIGCKTCFSLLQEIPSDRTCSNAGVSPHWCACHDLVELSVNRSKAEHWAGLVVRAINERLQAEDSLEEGYICAALSLRTVLYTRKKRDTQEYVIGIQTDPGGAQFEATIVKRGHFETVEDSLSRLNEFGSDSDCMRRPSSKIFCYCIDVYNTFTW